MSILADHKTPVLVQGISTPMGLRHTEQSIAYRTNIAGGVANGKGGSQILGVPIFNSVREAVKKVKPEISVIYSSPYQAFDDIVEAIEAEIPLIICTTERMPVHDMMKIKSLLKKSKSKLIGPAAQGIITAGSCKIGTMPAHLFTEGTIGIISRSSSLTYEAIQQMNKKGLGVSTCVALGAYPILGTDFVDIFPLFQKDKKTDAILLIGEIGGTFEQDLAKHYFKRKGAKKPLICYVAGSFVPMQTYMGNISAIAHTALETAAYKKEALTNAGAVVVDSPSRIGDVVFNTLAQKKDKK